MSQAFKGDQPLPALLNAMYLVGCVLSDDNSIHTLEPYYLAHTRSLLVASLADKAGSLIQWMQASCLVVFYLHRTGRFLEARTEVSQTGRS